MHNGRVGQGLSGSDLEWTEDWAAGGQGQIPGRCTKVQAESEGARVGWAGSPESQVGSLPTSYRLGGVELWSSVWPCLPKDV